VPTRAARAFTRALAWRSTRWTGNKRWEPARGTAKSWMVQRTWLPVAANRLSMMSRRPTFLEQQGHALNCRGRLKIKREGARLA